MGTSQYLDSVTKVLPAVQARQISELLSDLQASGQIRDAAEYQNKLNELASLVNDRNPTPGFQQIRALVWSLCSSLGHNIMMRALKDDIEAVFLQTNELGEKVNDHHFLFMQNLIADLERSLTDQENTIRRLQWLAEKENEFSHVLVNSFTSASLFYVSRAEKKADNLYFDNRTYANKNQLELPSAVVSERGQKLLLDVDNEPVVQPINVKIHTDENSYGTEQHVDINSSIQNIIDGAKGTFWTRQVYLQEKVPKVTTILEFDLGTAKDVDYIIIEGATSEPFYVEEIIGIASDGHRINLVNDAVEIDGKKRIDFSKTFLRSVLVTFAVYSYHRAEYFTSPETELHEIFEPGNRYNKLLQRKAIAPITRKALSSEKLIEICNVPNLSSTQISAYNYFFALDNVWFGNSLYSDTGIFVSKPLEIKSPGVLAIRVNEEAQTGTVQNTIEYEIIKIDKSPKYKETKFSIPYLGQTTVISERLVLSKKHQVNVGTAGINNVGVLRFCPYVDTTENLQGFDVYKNGELLNISSDWEFAITTNFVGGEGELDWSINPVDMETFSNFTLSPTKVWIRIKLPDLNAVYTVDYTIRTSDTYVDDETVWLDSDKTVSLSREGRVFFRKENFNALTESEIYLQITLRRNLASQTTSPALHEYAILSASYE